MSATVNNRMYDELAETWWDENKVLHLLKAMVNPWRFPYFKEILHQQHGPDLYHVRSIDIGSGGGILTEEFASLGCQVTGIDTSFQSIAAARAHATRSDLSIEYHVGSGSSLPFENQSYDVVSCCDVLEHIPDWRQVISEVARVLRPGGLFFFDTINRTLKSKAIFIYGLQEFPLTRLMPANTHAWKMFIQPEEISAALQAQGMVIQDMKGGSIATNPLATLWHIQQQKRGRITFAELGRRLKLKLDSDLSLNYLGYARKRM